MSSIHDLHHHFKQKERHIMKKRDDNISGFFGLCVFAFIHLARFRSCIKENTDTHERYAVIFLLDIRE